jgi:hypothetical protein
MFISALQIALVLEGAGLKCPGASSFQYTRVTFEGFERQRVENSDFTKKGRVYLVDTSNKHLCNRLLLYKVTVVGVFFQSMHIYKTKTLGLLP